MPKAFVLGVGVLRLRRPNRFALGPATLRMTVSKSWVLRFAQDDNLKPDDTQIRESVRYSIIFALNEIA
jgi:hypothetical protein